MSSSMIRKTPKEIPPETLEAFGGDELRARVFFEKYALRDLAGNVLERTPEAMWRRVAREIASVEAPEKRDAWEEKFYWLLEDFRMVPGGRILFGAGNPRRATLLNCYVIPIREDSIEGIFETAKEMARTYSFGGGCGTDISVLRPAGSPVNNSALHSTGAVSFMEIFSMTTGTIGQAGRRGALMLTIHVEHPDVLRFVEIKNDPDRRNVRFANISVLVSDAFMKAVEQDEAWALWYPDLLRREDLLDEFGTDDLPSILERLETREDFVRIDLSRESFYHHPHALYFYVENTGELRKKRVYDRIPAREIWDRLVASAWDSAEPGVIFWSTIKRYSTTEYFAPVLTTNPCSEIPLEAYGDCCLGNINLARFVKHPFTDRAEVDWEGLLQAARFTVRFLDNVLDYNRDRHPLPAQVEASMNSRRIGVGFTGLGDMLAQLRLKYDTPEAVAFVDRLFERIKLEVYDASADLAREKGSFPKFDPDRHLESPFFADFPDELREKIRGGLRNGALLTVPPVGSGSVLAGVSSGIEPIFALWYIRRSESLSQEEFRVYHPLVKTYKELTGASDEELPDFFVTAHEIDPFFRVKMQATIQKHIDHSISSTVNLPKETPKETIARVYLEAWRQGCKGITVYREGSREGILITEPQVKEKSVLTPRPRDVALDGRTYKVRTDMGNVYITVNRNGGGPMEVFVHLGKSGSTLMAFAEALGRLVSLALRSGVKPVHVIRQLEGIKSGPAIRQPDGSFVFSVPDAIAKVLRRFLEEMKHVPRQEEKPERPVTVSPVQGVVLTPPKDSLAVGDLCPECGAVMVEANGCATCMQCGYSRCG